MEIPFSARHCVQFCWNVVEYVSCSIHLSGEMQFFLFFNVQMTYADGPGPLSVCFFETAL